ncbi:MAG TPA: tripartite tricarboxylate transporter substrate-binding protein, partial [Xanthobacteraceae bacterium]|nr:tripartite tricarboxylate transporter substrate-binding protein [Xanthobacteraceae bacterium]
LLYLAAATYLTLPAPLAAQEWPDKPIKIMVGFGAGGGTDVATRVVADPLGEVLGQRVIVENRPGAGGALAGDAVAKGPKDGYTALMISAGHTVSAVMVKQLGYDPIKDFTPVGIIANSALVLVVGKDFPAKDLKGLVEIAKKDPGKYNYASVGVGSTQHLTAELITQRTGIQTQHVAFKNTGEVVTALIRNDVSYAVEVAHAVRGQVESGDLRVLAVTTAQRWPSLPNVPTLAEAGISGFEVLGWYGLVFPAGVPKAAVDKTQKALGQVLARENVKKQLENVGALAALSTPQEFGTLIEKEIVRWRDVATNAKLEAK